MKQLLAALGASVLLCACATRRPDHFYVLSAQPPAAIEARTAPATPVAIKVTLPSSVDRPEIVLNTSDDKVIVLEHERWAAPLADLAAQALARDLEQRRGELLISDSRLAHASGALKLNVDVVQMSLWQGGQASIEAHWRILDPRTGKEAVDGAIFSSPLSQDDYAAVSQALSRCLGLLADRLAAGMP